MISGTSKKDQAASQFLDVTEQGRNIADIHCTIHAFQTGDYKRGLENRLGKQDILGNEKKRVDGKKIFDYPIWQ